MNYLFITDAEIKEFAAKALANREEEYMNYEINRLNYEKVLETFSSLETEWPTDLLPYKNVFGEALAQKDISNETYNLITQYQHRDIIKKLLRTTVNQRDIGKKTYDALLNHLPTNLVERQALIEKIKSQREVQKAKLSGNV